MIELEIFPIITFSFYSFLKRRMTIDPEKGIHWPTMTTAVSSIIVWAIFVQLIVPNLPFFVRSYFPDVLLCCLT